LIDVESYSASRSEKGGHLTDETLLPATAAVVGELVLRQVPTLVDLGGITLVGIGIGLPRPSER
jgi:hypothetical protein